MNIRAIVIAAALMAGVSFSANAQTWTIARSVIGSGMTPISGGGFVLDGTIGQAIIGPAGSTSDIFIGQGFWYTFPTSGVTTVPGPVYGFALEQNYPNPFNPSTSIEYSVGVRSKVTIRVMNLLGEEVHAPLVDEVQGPSTYKIDFTDADNLPSGTYIYRMDATPVDGSSPAFSASKRMVLLK